MRTRIAVLAIAILLACGGIAFYVLAYTQVGIELAAGVLGRMERFGVQVEGVSGRLTGPLRIARFELDHERVHVVAEDIVIDVRLRWLALQTIDIHSLTLRSAHVQVRPPPDGPPPDRTPRFLPDFLRLAVDRATVDVFSLTLANGRQFTGSASAALRLRPDRIRFDEVAVTSPLFSFQGNGELAAARPVGLQFSGSGVIPDGERPDLDVAATASGTVESFDFTADLSRPAVARAEGRFEREGADWQASGVVRSEAFTLAPWAPQAPDLTEVAVDFLARPGGVEVDGLLTVQALEAGPLALTASGTFAERTLVISRAQALRTTGPGQLAAEGRVTFVPDSTPTLDLTAEWTGLSWPLATGTTFTSQTGQLVVSGSLPYRFSVDARMDGPRLPSAQGLVSGSVTREALVIDRYELAALEGTLEGSGMLTFDDRRWTLDLEASDVDPSFLHAEFPGRLSLQATASGRHFTREADFDVDVARLAGTLRGLPVRGRGQVARDTAGWLVRDVVLNYGDARLAASGNVGEVLDMQVDLQVGSLAALLPDAEGRLRFTGNVTGPLATPHVVADLEVQNLVVSGFSARTVTGSADVDLAGTGLSRLDVTARGMRGAGLAVERLRLNSTGNADSHVARLDLALEPAAGAVATVVLEATGRYEDRHWTGQLTTGEADTAAGQPMLRLVAPVPVNVSEDGANTGSACVLLDGHRLCGDAHWQRNGPWQVQAAGTRLPLATLGGLLPGQPRLAGSVDLALGVSGGPGTDWQGEASVVLTDGALIYQLSSEGADGTETVQFGSGRADLQITPETLVATMGIAASTETFIAGSVTATRHSGVPLAQLPLSGRIRGRMGNANVLPLLVPEIDHAAGVLTGDVGVSGSVGAPELNGRIELAQGELDLYRFNLALREIDLGLGLAANRLELAGTGRAGDGSWKTGGALAWRNGQPAGTLTLQGENLLVADLPEYRVVASPDLTFRIDGRTLQTTGEVFIPSARIQPTDLSGAVEVSPDSRLVQDEPPAPDSRFRIASDIRIRLGDDVQLDTFGLEGRLAGSVATTLRTGDIAIGRGELSVSNGKYEAYGQSLDIVRGRLLFDASPLDDPGLDIQAERSIQTTRVGLNVRGTLRDPRFGFYSEPAMSQTQILSYLLVGKPLDDLQNRDAATVGSARDALALQGGGFLAAQIGRRLGLEEVGVEANGIDDTALVLGKFLSPRLFVSYGISLTESINTLKLRYTITDRWILRTEAGEHQSADVEFTIERP